MITIVPYDTNWPAAFIEVARPLRAALGDLALRIDHIGSTSVPGLAAKDIIDVQITVADLACTPQLVDALG
ncbi:MAG: GrpB family protein, partial [Ktedonobacteraceae bacterium]